MKVQRMLMTGALLAGLSQLLAGAIPVQAQQNGEERQSGILSWSQEETTAAVAAGMRQVEGGAPSGSALTPQEAEKVLAAPAAAVVNALREKDMQALKPYIHPDKGVRFSPYAFVDLDNDLVFKPKKLGKLMKSKKVYTWGSYDGSGDPIKMTFSQYLNGFVYSRDYAHPEQMAYNTVIHGGNTTNNLREKYPDAAFVEYNFSRGADGNEMGWSSLRLVFEPKGDQWYLVGIINDQWTI